MRLISIGVKERPLRREKLHMRKLMATALLALFVGASAQAAVTVLTDDFNSYTNGNLSGQGGWTATAAAATPMQVAGASDKFVQIGTSGQDEFKAFTTAVPHTDGESIETKATVTVTSAQATGDYFLHLSNPAGTTSNFYQRTFVRSSGAGFQFGLVDTSGTGSTTTFGTTVLNLNQAYNIDIIWNFVAGGTNNDTFTFNVDGSSYLTHTWTSTATAEPTALAAANLRQGSATAAAGVNLDNLQVIASSVPEPAALGILSLALAAGANRRRR